jgi:hypothetical protein
MTMIDPKRIDVSELASDSRKNGFQSLLNNHQQE